MDPPPKRVHGVPWQAGVAAQAKPSSGEGSTNLRGNCGNLCEAAAEMNPSEEEEEGSEGGGGEADSEESEEEGIPDLDILLPESASVPPMVRSSVGA